MKRTIRKLTALVLVLTLVLSMSALAAVQTPSKGFKLPVVKARPTAAPENENSEAEATPVPTEPEATVAPEETPIPDATTAPEEAETEETLTVIATAYVTLEDASSSLNVRAAATTDSDCVGSLHHGDTVSVLGYEGDWTKILYGGAAAYVKSSYLSSTPAVEPTEEPVEEPTVEPAVDPTEEPVEEPTVEPTEEPTIVPTVAIRCITTGDIYYGDEVAFEAIVDGDVEVSYRWQYSTDDQNWYDVSGGNDRILKIVLTEENAAYYWRVEVDF